MQSKSIVISGMWEVFFVVFLSVCWLCVFHLLFVLLGFLFYWVFCLCVFVVVGFFFFGGGEGEKEGAGGEGRGESNLKHSLETKQVWMAFMALEAPDHTESA